MFFQATLQIRGVADIEFTVPNAAQDVGVVHGMSMKVLVKRNRILKKSQLQLISFFCHGKGKQRSTFRWNGYVLFVVCV